MANVTKGIRRFLLHVLPKGFHRIRHYGLLASSARKTSLARARHLLGVAPPPADTPEDPPDVRPPCPCCGGHMVVIETFERWRQPRAPPRPAEREDRAMTRHGLAANYAVALLSVSMPLAPPRLGTMSKPDQHRTHSRRQDQMTAVTTLPAALNTWIVDRRTCPRTWQKPLSP